MKSDYKINDFNVEFRSHFQERIKQREINMDRILHSLRDKYRLIKLYNNSGHELCTRAGGLTYFFQVRKNKIVLITALNKYAKHVKNAVII